MNFKNSLQIIFLIITVFSCSTSKKVNTEGNEESMNYKELAKQKLGEKVSYIANTNKTHMLCIGNNSENGVKYIQFFVFDLQSNEIIFEPLRRMRKVAWISANEIRADILTGMPANEGVNDYLIYNVIEKKETSLTNQ